MRHTRVVMGMPAAVEVPGADAGVAARVFALWDDIDARFSIYKNDSEVSRINRGECAEPEYSPQMREVLALAERTKKESDGYFDVRRPDGLCDPSGIVKGWAIQKAAELVASFGFADIYLEIAGDIQTRGVDAEGNAWSVGIRNPFNRDEVVKVLYPHGRGVATSGTAARGQHIYNPYAPGVAITDIMSITVVGPDMGQADRFATAAFAMGREGVFFIDRLPGFEAYLIDLDGIATMTRGLEEFLHP